MGQLFELNEDLNHVSTGKWPYPAGQIHDPEWGKPYHEDMGVMAQNCLFPACDIIHYPKKETQ